MLRGTLYSTSLALPKFILSHICCPSRNLIEAPPEGEVVRRVARASCLPKLMTWEIPVGLLPLNERKRTRQKLKTLAARVALLGLVNESSGMCAANNGLSGQGRYELWRCRNAIVVHSAKRAPSWVSDRTYDQGASYSAVSRKPCSYPQPRRERAASVCSPSSAACGAYQPAHTLLG